jgi:hypothetical protein
MGSCWTDLLLLLLLGLCSIGLQFKYLLLLWGQLVFLHHCFERLMIYSSLGQLVGNPSR